MLLSLMVLFPLIYADLRLETFQLRVFHSCVLFAPFVMAITLVNPSYSFTMFFIQSNTMAQSQAVLPEIFLLAVPDNFGSSEYAITSSIDYIK